MSLFRSLFVREDIWKQIAEDIGGEFIDGGFWEQGHVSYYHEEWEIILDSFERGHPETLSYCQIGLFSKRKADWIYSLYSS